MTQSSISESVPAANSGTTDASIGVLPDFHHLTSHSALALESYMHLYVDSTALTENLLKSSIERQAA